MRRLINCSVIGIFFILLIFWLVLSLPAQEESPLLPESESFDLSPRLRKGDTFIIEEEQKWDGTAKIEAEGKSQKFPFLNYVKNEYADEIIVRDNISTVSKRQYSLSLIKSNLPKEGMRIAHTSLEGKTIILEVRNHRYKITGNLTEKDKVILTEDLVYLTSPTDFFPLLPHMPVQKGEEWKIKADDFARIVFRDYYKKSLCLVQGTCLFEGITIYKGLRCAKVSVKLKLAQKKTKDRPKLGVRLTGVFYFVLGKRYIANIELSGPFVLEQKRKTSANKTAKVIITGTITISSNLKPE